MTEKKILKYFLVNHPNIGYAIISSGFGELVRISSLLCVTTNNNLEMGVSLLKGCTRAHSVNGSTRRLQPFHRNKIQWDAWNNKKAI